MGACRHELKKRDDRRWLGLKALLSCTAPPAHVSQHLMQGRIPSGPPTCQPVLNLAARSPRANGAGAGAQARPLWAAPPAQAAGWTQVSVTCL